MTRRSEARAARVLMTRILERDGLAGADSPAYRDLERIAAAGGSRWIFSLPAWLFIPAKYRRRVCEKQGTHHPKNIDGQRKLCLTCGAWS